MRSNLVILLFLVASVIAADEDLSFTYNGFRSQNLSLDGIHTNSEQPWDGFCDCFNEKATRARPSQFLGLFNESNSENPSNNHVVAVEFDTVLNDEFSDINDNHVGIDINSLKSVNSSIAGYYADNNGEFKHLTLASGRPMQVWVEYDGQKKQMNVSLAPMDVGKPFTPLLSLTRDLSPLLTAPCMLASPPPLAHFDNWVAINFGKYNRHSNCGYSVLDEEKEFAELVEEWEVDYGPQRYKYKDLYIATKGFRHQELLGNGGFGSVYRGYEEASSPEFGSTLGLLSAQGNASLVYDYMPNGSLEKYLYDQPKTTLNWNQRFVVIKGVASALFYLHEGWEQVVIHRDVKASNVLLDSEFNARLGDFGLARLYDHGTDPQTTHVVGTLGRPVEARRSSTMEDKILVDQVYSCWKEGDILAAKDPNFGTNFVAEEVELVMKLGLICSHSEPSARPSMRQVVQYLEGNIPLPDLALLRLSSSGLTFPSPERFVDVAMSYPSTMDNAFSYFFFCRRVGASLRLLVTLSFFLVEVIAAHEDLSFTYNGFSSANLSLDGVAEFTPNGLLRLTDIDTQRKGHAFYSNPVAFKNSMNTAAAIFSFSTTFVFAIRSEYPTLSGHGIAFVISPTRGLPGASPNHYLGLFNENNNGNENNHVVAVELDTIKSIDQFDDINNNHVGIDINGLKSEKVYTAGYHNDKNGEFKNLTLVSGKSMKVWVEYDGKKKQMNVTLAPSNIVNNTMYVGFSASTGSVPTSHYILGWSFKINGQAQELVLSQLPKLPRMGDKKDRSLILTVGLTLISVIIISLAISGIIYLIKRKRKFEELVEDWEVDYGPQRYKYKDLYIATKGFRDQQLFGCWGFGRVYKGILPTSNIEIAVKRVSQESEQGMREFVSEIVCMRRLRHRNLVPLLGYCRRKGELILVYDYMSNGSLDKAYKNRKGDSQNRRVCFRCILLEVACGRRPTEIGRPSMEDMILVDHVYSCWKEGAILAASDPNLGSDFVAEEVELVMKLGLMCSQSEPSARPSMRQVVRYLEGIFLCQI
ncbi:hypothetical protein FNV43_RR09603 [Rhamnella rubrinervis]|uniref:non-specific serine/threonine protein kinase n=1 Tax=Rhamnella rubrinervis TaxID=2594499 RepID=A0A8K0HAD7_9ROSA|nr:hypothetical protein FNV43_RR09603 [Rhamnella rubrinervis]